MEGRVHDCRNGMEGVTTGKQPRELTPSGRVARDEKVRSLRDIRFNFNFVAISEISSSIDSPSSILQVAKSGSKSSS